MDARRGSWTRRGRTWSSSEPKPCQESSPATSHCPAISSRPSCARSTRTTATHQHPLSNRLDLPLDLAPLLRTQDVSFVCEFGADLREGERVATGCASDGFGPGFQEGEVGRHCAIRGQRLRLF